MIYRIYRNFFEKRRFFIEFFEKNKFDKYGHSTAAASGLSSMTIALRWTNYGIDMHFKWPFCFSSSPILS
jgi:hypothetical protein